MLHLECGPEKFGKTDSRASFTFAASDVLKSRSLKYEAASISGLSTSGSLDGPIKVEIFAGPPATGYRGYVAGLKLRYNDHPIAVLLE